MSQTQDKDDRGICCPTCGCRHFYTTHTEPLRDGRIRRRKACRYCGRKILTFETTTAKVAPRGSGDTAGFDLPSG